MAVTCSVSVFVLKKASSIFTVYTLNLGWVIKNKKTHCSPWKLTSLHPQKNEVLALYVDHVGVIKNTLSVTITALILDLVT